MSGSAGTARWLVREGLADYKKANDTNKAVKVIVSYTGRHEARARKILKVLGLEKEESIVLIDARSDNKPSASKA